MPSSNASWVLTRAEKYFREIERLLLDLTFIRAKVRERMKSLAREYRTEFPFLRLSLYAQTREAQGEPTALYWGQFCRPPSELSLATAKGKKLYRWRRYCAGKLTSRMIFYGGGKNHKTRILDYDRRAKNLNEPYHILTKALLSIEHRMLNRRQGAAWESGGPEVPAPGASPNLRPESRAALEAAWCFVGRMAAVEAELLAIIDRYDQDPAHREFHLVCRRGRSLRYGKVLWLHHCKPLPADSKGNRDLTEARMRSYRIPSVARRALLFHERARRRMSRLHDRYIKVMGRMRGRAGSALRSVDLIFARPGLGGSLVS
jgi:hypothetical protein